MNKINDFLREASANAFEIAASDSNSTKYFSKFQLLSMCISAVFRSYGYEFHQVSAAMAVNTFLDYHKPTCNGVFPVVEYIHPTKQTALSSRLMVMGNQAILTTSMAGLTRKVVLAPNVFFRNKSNFNDGVNSPALIVDLEHLVQVLYLKIILKYLPEPMFSLPELDGIPESCSRHIHSFLAPENNVYPLICSRTRNASQSNDK
eukprot:g6902.t1